MEATYKNKAAEWIRRVVFTTLILLVLFSLGKCVYENRTVAEMNEYRTAFTYNGESYKYVPSYSYLSGKQMGKTQNGCRLYCVEGDDSKQFLIADSIGMPADPICFVKEGTNIPVDGALSSVIIDNRNATADEHILRAVQEIMEAEPTETVDPENCPYGTSVHLCFDGCVVSDRYAGEFFQYGEQETWYYRSDWKSSSVTPVTDETLLDFLSEIHAPSPWLAIFSPFTQFFSWLFG